MQTCNHFKRALVENEFGFASYVCDCLGFKKFVKSVTAKSIPILRAEFPNNSIAKFYVSKLLNTFETTL